MDALNRRDWLRVTGAAVLGFPLVSSAAPDLRARARKNLKLGVFTGVYASLPLEEAARRIAADGSPAEVLREPTIESVYHCRVGVHPDPECGALRVFPKRTRAYTQVGPKK